jgi:TM2 domain-containing membrane protein YozV
MFEDLIGLLFTCWLMIYLFQQFFGGIISLFTRLEKKGDVKLVGVSKT